MMSNDSCGPGYFPRKSRTRPSHVCTEAGAAYGHPFDRGCILDVLAAVLSVMTEVKQAAVTSDAKGAVFVNLHFCVDSPLVTVRARRDEAGVTCVRLAKPSPIRLRLPGWSPRDKARVAVDGKPVPFSWEGPYAVVAQEACPHGASVELHYELPPRSSVETLPVSRQQYRLSWRGDDVVACDPEVRLYQ